MSIPVDHLKAFAKGLDLKQAILFAYDGAEAHIVTWGDTDSLSDAAAEAANRIKTAMKWPEETIVESAKVIALREQISKLQAEVTSLKQPSAYIDQSNVPEVHCVELTEMDFGQRSEGYLCFLNKQDALDYIHKQTAGRTGKVPDSYMRYDYVGTKPCSRMKYVLLKMGGKTGNAQYIHVDKLADLLKGAA